VSAFTTDRETVTLRLASRCAATISIACLLLGRTDAAVFPPIVLQGCDSKVIAKHARLNATEVGVSASEKGDQNVGFDVSFVNTSAKVAKLVMIRIGDTDFAKVGTFSPDAVISWRIAAPPGACSVRGVRFADDSEWSVQDEKISPAECTNSDRAALRKWLLTSTDELGKLRQNSRPAPRECWPLE
jgi:hypothetical protein